MSAATDACVHLRADRDHWRDRATTAEAEVRRLKARLANVERDRRQLAAMRNAGDVVRVPLMGRAT